jgi:hypothetical protein
MSLRRQAAEALSALCDRYAASLDEETEAEYRRAFTKAVRRRLPALADEFERSCDRTVHPCEGLAPHAPKLLQSRCVEQPIQNDQQLLPRMRVTSAKWFSILLPSMKSCMMQPL